MTKLVETCQVLTLKLEGLLVLCYTLVRRGP